MPYYLKGHGAYEIRKLTPLAIFVRVNVVNYILSYIEEEESTTVYGQVLYFLKYSFATTSDNSFMVFISYLWQTESKNVPLFNAKVGVNGSVSSSPRQVFILPVKNMQSGSHISILFSQSKVNEKELKQQISHKNNN